MWVPGQAKSSNSNHNVSTKVGRAEREVRKEQEVLISRVLSNLQHGSHTPAPVTQYLDL